MNPCGGDISFILQVRNKNIRGIKRPNIIYLEGAGMELLKK